MLGPASRDQLGQLDPVIARGGQQALDEGVGPEVASAHSQPTLLGVEQFEDRAGHRVDAFRCDLEHNPLALFGGEAEPVDVGGPLEAPVDDEVEGRRGGGGGGLVVGNLARGCRLGLFGERAHNKSADVAHAIRSAQPEVVKSGGSIPGKFDAKPSGLECLDASERARTEQCLARSEA